MARKVQEGERRSGHVNFQGFVFQGYPSESLTSNTIEWNYSFGGGTIVDPVKKVTINNANAIKALETAKGWVGTISPGNVVAYREEEARNVWQIGNAAFMRNWSYAYALGQDPKSPIAEKFSVSVLPKGEESGRNAACLAGSQLMISGYSKNPDVAADLVRCLCSAEAQKKKAIELGQLPTRPALFSDPDLLEKHKWFGNALEALNNMVARPSTVTGTNYNQISGVVFENVNRLLSGGQSARDTAAQIEIIAKKVLAR